MAALTGIASAEEPKSAEPKLLDVAEVKRDQPVNFEQEVLPLLRKNCTACHNATTAENGLNLETPATMLKGGEHGPAVVAGKGLDSLLVLRARGGGDGPMPPADNKAGAAALSPQELGLLKLWIDQGATGTVSGEPGISWQPLPARVQPIYSVVLTPDGQFAACGRGNQAFVYQVPTGREVCRLVDPALSPVSAADHDLIQSLAFNPDGQMLATGGFQNVKLWQRPANGREATLALPAAARALAMSADGRWLAVAGDDHHVRLFELAGMKPGPVLAGHAQPVVAVRFSPDGALLFSASSDGAIRAWRIPTGEAAWQLNIGLPTAALAVIGPGPQLATGGADGKLRVWNPPTEPASDKKPEPVAELACHAKPITAIVSLATQAGMLYSAGEDGLLIVWDIAGKKPSRQINHGAPIAAIAVRADGQQLATAGSDKAAKLWNSADGKLMASVTGDVRAMGHAATSQRLLDAARSAAAAEKQAITDAENSAKSEAEALAKATQAKEATGKVHAEKQALAKKIGEENAAAIAEVEAAKVAEKQAADSIPAADKLVRDAQAAMAVVKKAADDATAAAMADNQNQLLAQAADKIRQVATAAEQQLAQVQQARTAVDQQRGAAAEKIKILSAELPKKAEAVAAAQKAVEEAALPLKAAERSEALASAAKTKADERIAAAKAAAAAADEQTKQAEAAANKAAEAVVASAQPLVAVAFSPDGAELATADVRGALHTWSTAGGAPLAAYEGHAGGASAIVYASAHRLLSTGADKSVAAWNTLPTWSLVRTIAAPGALADRVTALDFSPDGKLLATGSGAPSRSGELKLWNVADGALMREIPSAHSDTVLSVHFSPDGTQLASGSADKFVKVFDVASGKLLRAYEGHTHHVLSVAWRRDGKQLASAGGDNVIKLWNATTGEQVRALTGFGKEVTSVVMLGDGTDMLAASGDKSLRIKRNGGADIRFFGGSTDFIYSAAVSADGKTVIAGGLDGVLRVWNGDTGQAIRSFDPPPPAAAQAQR
jgi:WD40 repeat protein